MAQQTRKPDLETELEEADLRRVAMTVSCRDCDALPKAEHAGEVMERDGHRVQVMHNGLLIEEGCYYGPWMTHIIAQLKGHHEPQEEVVMNAILARLAAEERAPHEGAPTMIELGSFWAFYSMWFLTQFPDGRTIGMEPDPVYLDVGRRNFALNNLQGTFLHGAVGNQPGATVEFTAESTGKPVTVPQYDLDSLMAETDCPRADIVMVDIQGFETVLVTRAEQLIRSGAIRFMMISTHHHTFTGNPLTHQQLRDWLDTVGAHVVAEHSITESYAGDGLIAVSFDPRDRDFTVEVSTARSRETLFGESELQLNHIWHERDLARAEAAELRAQVERLTADPAPPPSLPTRIRSNTTRAARALLHRARPLAGRVRRTLRG